LPHVRGFRRKLHPAIHSGLEFVEAIFGAEPLELVGGSRPLGEKHSYSARFRELIEIVTS
jgi:hypothetical protein